MTENPKTCQKCGSPVLPGMKFCESCGAKIEALPACAKCGAPLEPGVKFCESCGAPVAPTAEPTSAAPAEPVPAATRAPEASAPPAAETPPVPVPEEKPVPPEPPLQKKEKPVAPPVPAAAPKEPVKAGTGKPAEAPAETGQKKPVPNQTMIIAGVVILLLLGAAAYFVVLPMLSGSGGTPGGTVQPGLPSLPALTQNQPGVQPSAVVTSAPSVSFETLPTQIPPADLLVTFQADRDPITGIVTITFTGGGGRYGVQNVDIRLTRSDGQVDTRTVTIDQIGNGMTLQGTKTGDDRIEIVANYFNGKQFRIIDKILEYKKRNW